MQDELLDIGRIEMKHPRFPVVDPDDGVEVMLAHEISPFMTARCDPTPHIGF
jgi:hypothetical protein